ncbi:MAG: hypothetical protein WCF77_03885 [Minisyncoccia bacterium]
MKRSYIIILIVIVILVVLGIVFLMIPRPSYAPTTAATLSASVPPAATTGAAPSPASPAAAAPASSPTATLAVMTSPTLGTYLAATNGMTLYTYSKDATGVSNCTGLCATFWPPYTVPASQALVAGSGVNGTIGTIARGGNLQITYKGMPLYFWASDHKPGDTTGQNINGFFVAAP